MRSRIETDYEIRYGYKTTCRKMQKEIKNSCEGLYEGDWSMTRVSELARKLNVKLGKSDTYKDICDKLYSQLLTFGELDCVLTSWDTGSTDAEEELLRAAVKRMLDAGYVFDGKIGKGGVMGTVWKVTQDSISYAAKLELHATTKLFQDDELSSILPEWHEIFEVSEEEEEKEEEEEEEEEKEGEYKLDIVVMELLETIDDVSIDSDIYEAIDGLIEDTADLGYEHDDVYPGNILTGPVEVGDSTSYNTYNKNGVVMKVVWGDVMSLSRAGQDAYKTMKEQLHEAFALDEDEENEDEENENDDD